jgi:DNA gyrase/topoisomerase IV subunit A
MRLFVKPNAIIREDGSDRIDIPVVTPEYIDNQIKIIETIGTLNHDEVIRVVRESRNSSEAKIMLVSKFNISDDVADFLLDMELREMDNYLSNAEFRKAEIAKWNTLREIIS